jgi:hypothetical protein
MADTEGWMSGSNWDPESRKPDDGEPVADPAEPAAAPPPPEPATGHVPPPIPPPVWPGGAPETVVVPPASRPKGRILAAGGIVAAVVIGLALKFVLPLVVGGVVGSALSGAFGGPWERLPSDVRDVYEQRLETAAGSQLDGLSDTQIATKIDGWLAGGYPRLDDAKLIRHLELAVQALNATDEATCAAFGRTSLVGAAFPDAAEAKLVGALDSSSTIEWVGLNVDAIEADLRGSPDPVAVSAAESDALVTRLLDRMSEAELATFAALGGGGSATDPETCGAIRALYNGILVLEPADKALMARIDVQP